MCGLAGIAGNDIQSVDINIFKDLLFVASMRGDDSTGVMIADSRKSKNSQHYAIMKEGIPSPQFIKKHNGMKGFLGSNYRANLYMGHARYGTIGGKKDSNAHPFDTPKLVGAHNGTIEDYPYSWPKDGKTDSQTMFEAMSEQGILPVLESLVDKRSAYAVTIYDKSSRHLYLARNSHRGLYVGFDKTAGVMYWSSEFYMLHLAAARNNVAISSFFLEPDVLYDINIDDIKKGETAPWTKTPIEYKKKSLVHSYWDDADDDWNKGWTKDKITGIWSKDAM